MTDAETSPRHTGTHVRDAEPIEHLDDVIDVIDDVSAQAAAQLDEVAVLTPSPPSAVLDASSMESWLLRLHPLHRASHASATWRAYASDLRHFATWCHDQRLASDGSGRDQDPVQGSGHGLSPLPAAPETVMAYLEHHGPTLKPSTLRRRLAAIRMAHDLAGLTSPTTSAIVTQAWRGLARTYGPTQSRRQSGAIITATLAKIVAPLGETPKDIRDRALLVIGFAGAFRRSELAALDVADIQVLEDGLRITVRKSKTDQEGHGRVVGLPYGSHRATCPVRSWLAWREIAGLTEEEPAFLSMRRGGHHIKDSRLPADAIARLIKTRAAAVGLDPRQLSGHSLRAGFATAAARAGVGDRDIMRQTGHRSPASLTPYIREGKLFESNAAARVGL